MDWKTRLILSILMTSVMVMMVTLLATWLALGFDLGLMRQGSGHISSRGRSRR